MSKSDSVKDRRKHQRVLVEPSSKVLTVEVEDYGKTLVFDMSYEGAAFAQPKNKKIEQVDEAMTLVLTTEIDQARIPAHAVRVNDEVVAVQFQAISVQARVIIDRVVTDRIVGLNVNLIDPKHYSEKSDFDFWFHGPKDTNLYLWYQGEILVKAQLEMANAVMVFEDDMLLCENKALMDGVAILNNQQIIQKADAILQQIEIENSALGQFKKLVRDHVSS